MSVDIATLGIKVDAREADNAGDSLDKLAKKGGKAEKATDDLTNSFGGLKTALGALGLAFSINELGQMADTYKNIQGKLGLVTSGTAELAFVNGKLFDIAQRTRSEFEAVTDLYGSLARSTKNLGTSQQDLLQVTETINQALIVSGANASSSEAALRQLGQGFASGALRGDELNSVLENTPRLAQAIADGMGKTVGELRKLGAEGAITGEAVLEALKSQRATIEAEFATMPTTISQSFTVLSNEVLKFVGEADSATGASSLVAAGIKKIAENIDKLALAVEVISVAIGIRMVAAFAASTAASITAAAALAGFTTTAGIAGFALGTLLKAFLGFAVIGAIALGIVAFTSNLIENNNAAADLESQHKELAATLILTGDNSTTAAKQVTGLGGDASASAIRIASFTDDVEKATAGLNDMGKAARAARLEMLDTKLMKARETEDELKAKTTSGIQMDGNRNSAAIVRAFRNGDMRELGAIKFRPVKNNFMNEISGGRASKEAEAQAYMARADRIKLERELKAEANSPDMFKKYNISPGGGATAGAKKKTDGAGGGGKSDAEREADRLERQRERDIKKSEEYVSALELETAAIGKNAIESRMLAFAKEAAEAPTKELATAITEAGEAWKKANNAEAVKLFRRELSDTIETQKFEASLVGKSNSEREEAIALRELEIRIMQKQREGIVLTAADIEAEREAIAQTARERGGLTDFSQGAARSAEKMRDMASAVRETAGAFGELFGGAAKGFADLITVMTDHSARAEELYSRQKSLDEQYLTGKKTQVDFEYESDRIRDEMANNQINRYGEMLGAAKGFFKEGTTGYKILEGIEKAYYLFKFAMQIKAMFFDKVQTASSVTNSGVRAAADGVAAIARAIASLPFPLNIAAGAATAAALIAFGVKVFGGKGGGGGKSASAAAEKTVDGYNGPRDAYGNPTSAYSVLKPGSTTVANDNSGGAPMIPSGSPGGNVSIGDVNLTVQGGADKNTVEQLQGMLEQNRQQTLAEARQLAAQDNAARNSRQFIGG